MSFLKRNKLALAILIPLFIVTIFIGYKLLYPKYKICMIINDTIDCEYYYE